MALQLLPALTRDPKVIAREKPVGAHLPYTAQIDDCTILTRDGLLMQTLHLRGLLFETADSDELNYRKTLRDAMVQAIGNARFALYHHIVRRKIDTSLDGEFPDDFSTALDRRWHARHSARSLYVNDLYLTLVRRPLKGSLGLADRLVLWLGRSGNDARAQLAGDLHALSNAREALEAALGSYGPKLLTCYESRQGACSEALEFLSQLLNDTTHPVLLPHGDIATYLPERRISFGQTMVELGEGAGQPRRFSSILSVKDYAGETSPGMFDELMRLPFEMTVSQSFGFVDRGKVLSAMNLAIRRMRASEDEALSLRSELADAKDEVAAGRAAFGEHHMTIAVHGDTPDALPASVAEVAATLADLGIMAVREEIALEPAFWAQFPGNYRYIPRRALVSSANFAGLASGHNFATGSPRGNHWGDAVSLLETTAAGPYFFNFHVNDLGNFTVIGPSGSGKTVVLNFLLAQARRYDPRIVFFDKDRGAELFLRAIGGRYDRLHPEARSAMNPLQIDDTPSNRQFLLDWLSLLASQVDGEESAQLKDAIDANFAQPPNRRRLRFLVELLRGHARPNAEDLWSRLAPWWGEGERAWLFDNAEDTTGIAEQVVGFDMTAILDDPRARSPAMLYLFHRIEARLDGQPTIIVVDEGWKVLDDEIFVARVRDWEKTIRKKNGIVGFATQSARDALDSRIASAIIEQAATQIFMVNPKARATDYCEGFGLTAHELELIRSLPDSAHCFLVRHGKDSVVVRLDLTGEADLLTILSGREASVRKLDALRAETGDNPAAWLPRMLEPA